MKREEYEQIYQNALRSLDLFGVRVGRPFTRNGKRYCAIDGAPKDDQGVFCTIWGTQRAKLIQQASQGTSFTLTIPA